ARRGSSRGCPAGRPCRAAGSHRLRTPIVRIRLSFSDSAVDKCLVPAPRTSAPQKPPVLLTSCNRPKLCSKDERGFTMVEMLVAILILVVGLLGTVMLINAANGTTLNNNLRETANNVSREVAEAANGLTYASVTSTGLVPAMQAQPRLADGGSTAR